MASSSNRNGRRHNLLVAGNIAGAATGIGIGTHMVRTYGTPWEKGGAYSTARKAGRKVPRWVHMAGRMA